MSTARAIKVTACVVTGCERGAPIVRGMCRVHYERWMNHGTTDLLPVPTVAERLAAGLTRMPNGCLEWTGRTNRAGYGVMGIKNAVPLTHRVVWTLTNGPIPDGLLVCHHCDNPPCAETAPSEAFPDGHLFLGTDADNAADKFAKGRDHSQRRRAS